MTGNNTSWTHIEYGAANYGAPGRSPRQLDVLFKTLDDLMEEFGKTGIFYVNDLAPDTTAYVSERLKAYCTDSGYTKIDVRELPGDFTTMEPPESDTAHLKNPWHGTLDNLGKRKGPTCFLQTLANASTAGLEVHTFHRTLIPNAQKAYGFDMTELGEGEVYINGDVGAVGIEHPRPAMRYLIT